MKICPNCGTENNDSALECVKCFATLAEDETNPNRDFSSDKNTSNEEPTNVENTDNQSTEKTNLDIDPNSFLEDIDISESFDDDPIDEIANDETMNEIDDDNILIEYDNNELESNIPIDLDFNDDELEGVNLEFLKNNTEESEDNDFTEEDFAEDQTTDDSSKTKSKGKSKVKPKKEKLDKYAKRKKIINIFYVIAMVLFAIVIIISLYNIFKPYSMSADNINTEAFEEYTATMQDAQTQIRLVNTNMLDNATAYVDGNISEDEFLQLADDYFQVGTNYYNYLEDNKIYLTTDYINNIEGLYYDTAIIITDLVDYINTGDYSYYESYEEGIANYSSTVQDRNNLINESRDAIYDEIH